MDGRSVTQIIEFSIHKFENETDIPNDVQTGTVDNDGTGKKKLLFIPALF